MSDASYQPKVYREQGGDRMVVAVGGELLVEGAIRGLAPSNVYFVDGDNGADTNDGLSWAGAFATIQAALTAAVAGDTIYVLPKATAAGGTDPTDYAETLTIAAGKSGLRLIGVSSGVAQGAQPHIKKGSGSTALLTVRSPGCLISGLSFNGSGSTGGGILLDDDAATKSAFGTVIENCFFKNCKGSAAAATGGAIQWSAAGGAWQVRISGCHFFQNRGGIVLLGTSGSRPKDVIIEKCTFGSDVNTAVDADIYLGAGSGAEGLLIRNCDFQTVDVPGYATSPTAARYVSLAGCEGAIAHCTFACTGKTFGAEGDGATIPTTVRISGCHQESGLIGRT